MLEAGRLYCDIVKGKLNSPLAQFSEVQLLFLLQMLIRQRYSYKFFKSAIDDTAMRIADALEHDEVKAYALFFIETSNLDGRKIPQLLKSYSKSVKKLLKANPERRATVERLIKAPIRSRGPARPSSLAGE